MNEQDIIVQIKVGKSLTELYQQLGAINAQKQAIQESIDSKVAEFEMTQEDIDMVMSLYAQVMGLQA